MKSNFYIVVGITLIFLLGTLLLQAQTPQLLNYQGKLSNKDGTPANGTFIITFSIYPDERGIQSLWSETDSVTVMNGLFHVLLGSTTPFPADLFAKTGARYLGIKLERDLEMRPLFQLTSVPFSMSSRQAGTHQKVAFSAYVATNDLDNDRDPLPMKAFSNNIGGHYDPVTSKFTAPVKGVYLFTMTAFSAANTAGGFSVLHWFFKVNNQYANSTGLSITEPSEAAQISNYSISLTASRTILLALDKGDKVHIQQLGVGRCDNFRSGLEGVLLYADEE